MQMKESTQKDGRNKIRPKKHRTKKSPRNKWENRRSQAETWKAERNAQIRHRWHRGDGERRQSRKETDGGHGEKRRRTGSNQNWKQKKSRGNKKVCELRLRFKWIFFVHPWAGMQNCLLPAGCGAISDVTSQSKAPPTPPGVYWGRGGARQGPLAIMLQLSGFKLQSNCPCIMDLALHWSHRSPAAFAARFFCPSCPINFHSTRLSFFSLPVRFNY